MKGCLNFHQIIKEFLKHTQQGYSSFVLKYFEVEDYNINIFI